MGTVKSIKSKILVILIVFMMMFSNFGFTLSAIATSDEFEVITNGFFKKDEVKFKAYFEDENGKEITELTQNVNQKIKLVLEVLPQVEGYLKTGKIEAVSGDESEINFKFANISQNLLDELDSNINTNLDNVGGKNDEASNDENQEIEEKLEDTNKEAVAENVVSEENTNTTVENDVLNNEVSENKVSNEATENTANTNTVNENVANQVDANNTSTNTVNDTNTIANENTVSNENVVSDETEENEELVNEDQIIEEKTEEANQLEDQISNAILDVKIESDNEISLSNIIEPTKIVVDLEYVQGENLKIEDLYKNIKLQLSGTYVNSDLQEVQVGKEEEVNVGWKYSKDISLESEYTKFSPFEIGDIKGTIVENKITLKREINDEKYLPIKTTNLEVEVPKVNGKTPTEVDVIANKLLATKGEDTGSTNFSTENWKYNEETGKIEITVNNEENGLAVNAKGEDEYVIIYRYEDYVDAENSNLLKKVTAKVEEYSAKGNNILTKEINNSQDVKVDVGELITYNISTTEDKINKAKVYANYNSEEAPYETEFTSQVKVNILTSDILEQLKIDCTKEVYKDANGVEFKAEGIEYKKIKFNYSDIKEILSQGGEIVITNSNAEILYTLNGELINSEEDCSINLNNANGIIVYANNIAKNGTIDFELTKAIKKCNYDKTTFKSFTGIESRVTAEVKYLAIDQKLELETIGTTKEFSESTTSATLSINKENLSTIKSNDNVELKIELNNDKETSDLYVNPSFELVFPKYVKAVSIESINLLYENGLRVSDFHTYTENDIVKMKVELTGTQTRFSDSKVTNGTNIIINANIDVDDYTPSKEDQIKLYYCNEGVSNYESQTKWTINKQIPNGILKTTNGFDVALVKYQAPSGLVTINGIVNYDGNLSEVKSVKQGPVTKQVPINSKARVATMELLALNNTENTCSDITLLGRIPFKGNKDVTSNEDLGTTTNVKMVDIIKEDIQNLNMTTIYYSTNENANKNLDDISNGWTTEAGDLSAVRSFLIVVKGSVAPGAVLRYTYDFEIPENLPYDASIAGSFGGFYNNNTDVAVVYETSSADKVGLTTEAGPKLEASLSVDVGDGAEVLSNKNIKYTVKVSNTGSVVANDLIVNASIPAYSNYVKKDNPKYGDYGFKKYDDREVNLPIGTLNPGETKEVSYFIRTTNVPTLEEYAYKDENGYYIITGYEDEEVEVEEDHEHEESEEVEHEEENTKHTVIESKPIKEYITEVPDIYITNKVSVTAPLLSKNIETNEVKNKLKQANFSSEIRLDFDRNITAGMETNFSLVLKNTSGKNLENVVSVLNIGDIYKFESGKINDKDGNIEFKEDEGKVYFYIGNMNDKEEVTLSATLKVNQINSASKTVDCYFDISADGIETEKSTIVPQTVMKSVLEAKDITITLPETINENETITISTQITNTGAVMCTKGVLEAEIPEKLDVVDVIASDGSHLSTGNGSGMISAALPVINGNESITVDIVLKAKNTAGSDPTDISITRIIHNLDQEDITLEPIEFTIINNEKTDDEIEDDRLDELDKENEKEDQANKDEENNNQDNSNTDSDNNSSDNTSNDNTNSSNNNNNNDNNSQKQPENNNGNNNNNNETDSKNENVGKNNPTYSISGLAWLDANKNGIREDGEMGISGVKVYLLTSNNTMLKSTITGANGAYQFVEVENGKYVVAVEYDENKYATTAYKKSNVAEDRNSDVLQNDSKEISAITNEINVANSNISNIDIGLQNKDTFDLTVNKYISKVTVESKNKQDTYEFDNLDVAKVEIPSKKINGAKVNLEYTIVIENIGNIEGYAEKLVDYVPNGMEFDETRNTDWVKGTDGYIYAQNLNQTLLKQGDKKELKLILTKTMNEDTAGTISNKIALLSAFNQSDEKEKSDNNTNIQNTLILVSTGYTLQISILIICAILISIIIINKKNGNLIRFASNRVYKTDVKKKNKPKKFYK